MKTENLTPLKLKEFGFKSLRHYTITGSMILDIGRNRQLSIGCIGTPNEMVWISEIDDKGIPTDLVCISNYDYDGYFTVFKLKILLSLVLNIQPASI